MAENQKQNIYQKMLAITSELTKVAKNLQVGEGKYSYKAVGEADILAAVRPLEEKHGIYSYPVNRRIVETAELETKSGAKNLFLRLEVVYRFVNTEKPDEYIDIVSYGDGVDSQDKAPGKAMTYADKYALMKAYKIMTGDDPDQNMSEELKTKNKGQKKPNFETFTQPQGTMDPSYYGHAVRTEMTEEQKAIINGLTDKLKAFACKKYNLQSIDQLSKDQAEYIINSLREKGANI